MLDSDKLTQADRDRAHFDTIAKAYQRKDLSASSRVARRHRLQQTVARFHDEMQAQKLLEVGCGAGFSVDYLEDRCGDYLGIDPSSQLIGCARRRFTQHRFHCGDILSLEGEQLYNGIFMVGVLHHMESPEQQLTALEACMVPGAWIAMNEPNSANLLIQLLRRIRKICDQDYSAEQRTYTSRSLRHDLEAAGFEDVDVRAQGFFSTPFAEVPFRPGSLWAPLAHLAVLLDQCLENRAAKLLRCVSWNLVATGRKRSR